MRFAECHCPKCGIFLITFKREIPELKELICPCCDRIEGIKVKKLDE